MAPVQRPAAVPSFAMPKNSISGIIPQSKWLNEVKPIYEKWANREGNYDDYIVKMFQVYTESIKGLNYDILSFLASQTIQEKGDRLYRFTKDKLIWHKKQGHKVIIISGSAHEIVSALSKKLDVDDCIGTIYKTNDKKEYTGDVEPMWDKKHKLIALKEFCDKYDIDLEKSYAYGDTNGDFEMLSSVGNPTAINPTVELINSIKSDEKLLNKINVIVERKDAIYKIDLNTIDLINIK